MTFALLTSSFAFGAMTGGATFIAMIIIIVACTKGDKKVIDPSKELGGASVFTEDAKQKPNVELKEETKPKEDSAPKVDSKTKTTESPPKTDAKPQLNEVTPESDAKPQLKESKPKTQTASQIADTSFKTDVQVKADFKPDVNSKSNTDAKPKASSAPNTESPIKTGGPIIADIKPAEDSAKQAGAKQADAKQVEADKPDADQADDEPKKTVTSPLQHAHKTHTLSNADATQKPHFTPARYQPKNTLKHLSLSESDFTVDADLAVKPVVTDKVKDPTDETMAPTRSLESGGSLSDETSEHQSEAKQEEMPIPTSVTMPDVNQDDQTLSSVQPSPMSKMSVKSLKEIFESEANEPVIDLKESQDPWTRTENYSYHVGGASHTQKPILMASITVKAEIHPSDHPSMTTTSNLEETSSIDLWESN